MHARIVREAASGRRGGGGRGEQSGRVVLGDVVVEVVFAREPLVADVALDLVGLVHESVARQNPPRREQLPTHLALVLRRRAR